MIDVKDEILSGAPRYRIIDENENVINNNVSIEMITPLQQRGTPLNKALFDKIDSLISDYQKIDRYNPTTYSAIETTSTQNILVAPWNGTTTEISNEFVTISGDVEESQNDIRRAFDGDVSTEYYSQANEIIMTFAFKNKIKINQLQTYITETYNSKPFEIYGSDVLYTTGSDVKSNGTLLATSNPQNGVTLLDMSGANYFKYYYMVNGDRNFVSTRFRTYTFETSNFTEKYNLLTCNIPMLEYVENGILKIKTPSSDADYTNYTTKINVNGLGEKEINGVLKNNTYYTLIYNGVSFDAIELGGTI